MAFGIYRLSTLMLPLLAVMVLQVFGKEASCFDPLGMEDGTIKDSQISASSIYSNTNGGSARLRKNLKPSGAWCPNIINGERDKIKYDEYIRIDLLDLTTITKVATQGRELNSGKEYTKIYKILYSHDGKTWLFYKSKDNAETKVFSGNTDVKTVVENKLDPPIIARYVSILPGYIKGLVPCLRLELYGCPWNQQGILSYTMPEGQVAPNGKNKYKDTKYTGTKTDGMLHGGTGLLTDGEIGPVDSKQYGGEGWVGWMQAEQHGVNITFEFDYLRNFIDVTITVNINKKRSNSLFNKTQIFIVYVLDDNNKTFQTCSVDSVHGPCFRISSSVSPSLTTLSAHTTTLSSTESSSSHLLYILIALVCVFCVIGLVIIALLLSRRKSKKSKRNQDVSLETRIPSLLNDNFDVLEVPVSSNQLANNEENQAEDDIEEGYVNPDNNVTPHHPVSSNQLPNNEENQAEDDIEEGYVIPDNNVTPHHPLYTALMKRTDEDDHTYQELLK